MTAVIYFLFIYFGKGEGFMIKRLLKIFTVSAAMVILTIMALSIPAGANVTWHSEQADTGRRYPEGLGYDASGNPSIVQMDYYSTPYQALYRYRTSAGWVSETIGEASKAPVLAFNNSGQPSVIYVRYANSTYTLIYAKRTATNTWQEITVDSISQGYIDSQYSLAFNSSGNPCVSYVKVESNPYSPGLYYAVYNGSTWQKQLVYSVNDVFYSNLTFNGATPAIAFSAGKQGLKYAYLSGGNWTIQTVDPSSTDGLRNRQSDLTLRFGNGKPLICYNDQGARSLKFAYYLNGSWTTSTVEASESSNNYTGEYATMQVSQAAGSYVVYLVHSNYWLNGTTTIRLKTLAVNSDSDLTGMAFSSQTLYTGQFGNMSPLLVSGIKDGNPAVMFLNILASRTFYISMQPDIQAPSSVSFEASATGSSSSKNITITNNGSLNLSVSEITPPSAPFRITGGASGSLAPGESRVFTVYFEPAAAGVSYSGTIVVKSNDPDQPVFNISLTGRSIGSTANLTGLGFSNSSSLTLLPDDTGGNLTVAFDTETIKITPTAAHAYAQIKIEGVAVQNSKPSGDIPLQIGINTVTMLVTSEDTATQKTYTLNITRLDSPDARLSALTVSKGTLSPAFSPEIFEYNMTLPNGASSFSFTPSATPMGALGASTISINVAATPNGSASGLLSAAVGRNTYTIRVVAPDNESELVYSVTVFRLPELSGISLDRGELGPDFNPYGLSYTAVVPNSVATISITPFIPTAEATFGVKVNGNTAVSAVASAPISLETGENIISIEVRSEDGHTTRTYTLTITRLPGLAALYVGNTQVMISEFVFENTVEISDAQCPIIFSAPDGMSVEISGISASEDGISEPISFQEGLNGPYTIKLISEECAETTVYSLTVIRRPLLTSLEIAESEIMTLPDEYYYVVSPVKNTAESVVISAAANTGTAIAPEGNFIITEVAGQTNTWTVKDLLVGLNPIYLRLRAYDEKAETLYALIIPRLPGLSELSVDGETLTPAFHVDTYDYSVNVSREISAVTLNAKTSDLGTTLSINGADVVLTDYLTDSISLDYGSNIIPVVVMGEGYVSAEYTVNVIRQEPEAGTISPTSAGFNKYVHAAGNQDISVTVAIGSNDNPLLAIKNGDSTLAAGIDYTVSGSTYTIKKEYLSTLSAGAASLTFDFKYNTDAILTVSVSDSTSATGGSPPTQPAYYASVSGGGAEVPVNVNTDTGNASVDIVPNTSVVETVVEVEAIPGVNSYTVNIPSAALTSSGGASVTLKSRLGSISMPTNMLSGIGLTGKAGVTISEGRKEALPDDIKSAIGDRPLIQLTLSIDGRQTEWSNPDAPVTVSVPYVPTSEELANPERIVIWYIDSSGNATCVINGSFDPETGTVTFTTTHFSDYAVVYNPIDFGDVNETAWFYKAVSYLAAREITNGTGDSKFSPDSNLKRGEFIVMLMRAYGIKPDGAPTDNFADAGSTYYTGYLAAAKRLGLADGVGNNRYAPEREITRQEMFTLLYNILTNINRLPQGDSSKTISDFSDAGQIASWATDAVALLIETGIVEGNAGKLYPTDSAKRAEMAQMLYKLEYLMRMN